MSDAYHSDGECVYIMMTAFMYCPFWGLSPQQAVRPEVLACAAGCGKTWGAVVVAEDTYPNGMVSVICAFGCSSRLHSTQ